MSEDAKQVRKHHCKAKPQIQVVKISQLTRISEEQEHLFEDTRKDIKAQSKLDDYGISTVSAFYSTEKEEVEEMDDEVTKKSQAEISESNLFDFSEK